MCNYKFKFCNLILILYFKFNILSRPSYHLKKINTKWSLFQSCTIFPIFLFHKLRLAECKFNCYLIIYGHLPDIPINLRKNNHHPRLTIAKPITRFGIFFFCVIFPLSSIFSNPNTISINDCAIPVSVAVINNRNTIPKKKKEKVNINSNTLANYIYIYGRFAYIPQHFVQLT